MSLRRASMIAAAFSVVAWIEVNVKPCKARIHGTFSLGLREKKSARAQRRQRHTHFSSRSRLTSAASSIIVLPSMDLLSTISARWSEVNIPAYDKVDVLKMGAVKA